MKPLRSPGLRVSLPALVGLLTVGALTVATTSPAFAQQAQPAAGVYLSLVLDLPTGATIVCTFGAALIVMAAIRPLTQARLIRVPTWTTVDSATTPQR